MPKHLILVAGNIGSGKTSLTERIGQRLGWHTAYESVADNPYLPNFYKDMKSWSFHLQVYFLGHRARQHLQMAQDPRSTIIDRSIYEDAYIFCRALNHLGNLNELDYQTYLSVLTCSSPHCRCLPCLFTFAARWMFLWHAFTSAPEILNPAFQPIIWPCLNLITMNGCRPLTLARC